MLKTESSILILNPSPLTVRSISVSSTIDAVTSMSSQVVQVSVEEALHWISVAVAGFALVGALVSGTTPRRVVVEWQTLFAVRSVSEMFALADLDSFSIEPGAVNAFVGVTVTLTASTDGDISDGIEVGTKYLFVAEQLVTESVESVEWDSDVCGSDPLVEFNAVLEVVGARTSLERRKSDVTELKWGDVTVLAGTQGSRLAVAFLDWKWVGQAVGASTGCTVVLVRNPWTVLRCTLVDRKGFGSRRVENDADVGDVKGFSWKNYSADKRKVSGKFRTSHPSSTSDWPSSGIGFLRRWSLTATTWGSWDRGDPLVAQVCDRSHCNQKFIRKFSRKTFALFNRKFRWKAPKLYRSS